MKNSQSISLTPRFSEVGPVADRLRTVSSVSPASAAGKSCHAFTFIELLIVVAVLALMVCLLATARAGSRPNFQAAVCLNNLRQLMSAFTMYTHDYNEFFLPNPDTVTGIPGGNWVGDYESGWMPVGVTNGSLDAGNPDLLKDPKWNRFAPYIRTNISLYRCPFDPRIVPYTG